MKRSIPPPKRADPRPTEAYDGGPGGNSSRRLGIPQGTRQGMVGDVRQHGGRRHGLRPRCIRDAGVLNFPAKRVKEPLLEMKCGIEDGCSPVIALKRKHSMRKKRLVNRNMTKLKHWWRWRRTVAATAPPPVPTRLSFLHLVMNLL
ncbi:hypothetical protein ACS0TY_003717 [Phlomoides rotata]